MKTALTLGTSLQGRILRYLNIKHKKVGYTLWLPPTLFLPWVKVKNGKTNLWIHMFYGATQSVWSSTSNQLLHSFPTALTCCCCSALCGPRLSFMLTSKHNAGSSVTAGVFDHLSKTKPVIQYRTIPALCAAVAKSQCASTGYNLQHHMSHIISLPKTDSIHETRWHYIACESFYLFCLDCNSSSSSTIWTIPDWVTDRSYFHNWPAKSAKVCRLIYIWHNIMLFTAFNLANSVHCRDFFWTRLYLNWV